jgi:hypothetical protein
MSFLVNAHFLDGMVQSEKNFLCLKFNTVVKCMSDIYKQISRLDGSSIDIDFENLMIK